MKIVFLGIGGWISRPKLGFTSIAILGRHGGLLLEASEGVYHAMDRCGIDINAIDTVFLSHRHGDHILGIPTLVQLARYQHRKLRIIGSRDVIESVKVLLNVVGVNGYGSYIDFTEVKHGDEVSVGSYVLRFVEVQHAVPSLAVRVEYEGKCVVYSGDTTFAETLIPLAHGCDLLIHEVSGYSDSAKLYGHSTLYNAVEVAYRAKVKRLAIVHFYIDSPPLRVEVLRPLIERGVELIVPYPCYSIEL